MSLLSSACYTFKSNYHVRDLWDLVHPDLSRIFVYRRYLLNDRVSVNTV